ncbi:MAG: RES family NAD+ phosphorylase [Phycisphaerales bacterium]|nr:RES family NAD+ phosphorylase [Phycisphaerales bacterium]
MRVCHRCFGESRVLRERIEQEGQVSDCPTCGTKGVHTVEVSDLSDLFDGLAEYYEPLCGNTYEMGKDGVYGFGVDTGHENLVDILRSDWELFSDVIEDDKAHGILEEVWPGYTGEYERRPGDRPTETGRELERIAEILRHAEESSDAHNRAGDALSALLNPWVDCLRSRLATARWMRARIQDGAGKLFDVSGMTAPPPEKATAGRANKAGERVLYVASDEATAVAEVRAEPGDWVTVATVEVGRPYVGVLDLSRDVRVVDPFAHSDLDQALMAREFLQRFGYELSRPVRAKDSTAAYIVTQTICEYFRRCGFDGVLYPSAMTTGVNAVFFDAAIGKISNPVEMVVWSKALDVVTPAEFGRRGRSRLGYPF